MGLPINKRFETKHVLIFFGVGFVVLGLIILPFTIAASPAASIEAENGSVTAPAQTLADQSASGGNAVQFQAQPADKVKTLLAKYTPGTLHEAIPHGVPANFDWQTKSTIKRLTPPDATTTYLNIRGAVYVDTTNVRPANTRVEIMDCTAYGLLKSTNTWEKYIDLSPGNMTGRAWKEDFSVPGDANYPNIIKTEADGGKSVINYNGFNFHYYNGAGVALVNVGSKYKQYVTSCSTRLVLNNPAGTDDRSQSTYLIDVGNDWKHQDGSCTVNSSGSTLCYAIGAGRFIRVQPRWRRVVFSSMTSADLDANPLPPESVFTNPDGSFGD